jgi:hypothetical protein
MKHIKYLVLPILFMALLLSGTMTFTSCEPEDDCTDTIDTTPVLRKPNIYIYPQETIQLKVSLNFPQGGEVINSIPEYGTGWNVSVEPGGLIDNTCRFLFYESILPDSWQYSKGWIRNQADLEDFFCDNLLNAGFRGQEIEDFIDYWIPLLSDYPFYAIYPQTVEEIEQLVELNFSVEPDSVLRLFYVIKAYEEAPVLHLAVPEEPDAFERAGFFVVEWGGILK